MSDTQSGGTDGDLLGDEDVTLRQCGLLDGMRVILERGQAPDTRHAAYRVCIVRDGRRCADVVVVVMLCFVLFCLFVCTLFVCTFFFLSICNVVCVCVSVRLESPTKTTFLCDVALPLLRLAILSVTFLTSFIYLLAAGCLLSLCVLILAVYLFRISLSLSVSLTLCHSAFVCPGPP